MSTPFNPRDLFFSTYAKKAPVAEPEPVEEEPEEPPDVSHRDLFFGVGKAQAVADQADKNLPAFDPQPTPDTPLPVDPLSGPSEPHAGEPDSLLAELSDIEDDPDAEDRQAALERTVAARKAEQAQQRARMAPGWAATPLPEFSFGSEPEDVTQAIADGAPAALRSKQVTLSRRLARYVLRLEVRDSPIDSDFFWGHDDLPIVQRAFARAGLPWLPLYGVVSEQD